MHSSHDEDEGGVSMEGALHDAVELLQREFGSADQSAAVALATFLFHTRERDAFLGEGLHGWLGQRAERHVEDAFDPLA